MSEKTMPRGEIQVFQNQGTAVPDTEEKEVQRVAAYCRVSTLMEEQEDSYETQQAYYKQLIDANPKYILVDVYGDHGVSGLSMKKRTEFCRMMQDCMDGKVDLVMTKSISRFARNLADCVKCVRLLREKGIPVLFEKEGLNSTDPSCEMILSVLATLAQEESNSISQNITWAHNHRNASGCPSRVARYGYRKKKDDSGKKGWVIYEPEAELVRLAFDMAARGEKYKAILAALNDMEKTRGTGVLWNQPRLHAMLTSETYIGDILTNKTYTPDFLTKRHLKNNGERAQYYIEKHHAPIVDKATFERVAEYVKNKALCTVGGGRKRK